jgi:hypothetical protein
MSRVIPGKTGFPRRDTMQRRAILRLESESVLDLYNLLLAAMLFASPWFFAHASRTAASTCG